jgi:hypothetical protein
MMGIKEINLKFFIFLVKNFATFDKLQSIGFGLIVFPVLADEALIRVFQSKILSK